MANQYGMVDMMKRYYRTVYSAQNAALRRAKSTGKPCWTGMLLDCKFHLTDEDPRRDFRFETYLKCTPDGKTIREGR